MICWLVGTNICAVGGHINVLIDSEPVSDLFQEGCPLACASRLWRAGREGRRLAGRPMIDSHYHEFTHPARSCSPARRAPALGPSLSRAHARPGRMPAGDACDQGSDRNWTSPRPPTRLLPPAGVDISRGERIGGVSSFSRPQLIDICRRPNFMSAVRVRADRATARTVETPPSASRQVGKTRSGFRFSRPARSSRLRPHIGVSASFAALSARGRLTAPASRVTVTYSCLLVDDTHPITPAERRAGFVFPCVLLLEFESRQPDQG